MRGILDRNRGIITVVALLAIGTLLYILTLNITGMQPPIFTLLLLLVVIVVITVVATINTAYRQLAAVTVPMFWSVMRFTVLGMLICAIGTFAIMHYML